MAGNGTSFITPVAVGIPFDNSTDGWVANNVQAAIEEAPIHLRAGEVSSTADATLATSATLLPGITTTLVAGSYLVWFSASLTSAGTNSTSTFGLYVGGTLKADSVRIIQPYDGGALSAATANGGVSINAFVTFASSTVVQIRALTAAGTATCHEATMNWLRCT